MSSRTVPASPPATRRMNRGVPSSRSSRRISSLSVRSGQVQPLCGPAEMKLGGHRHERLKLPQFHT